MRLTFLSGFFILFLILPGLTYSLSLSASFPKSDSLLLAQIQAQIAADPTLSTLPVDVRVTEGQVKLKGIVPQKVQALAFIILVQSTAGVLGLDLSEFSLQKGALTSDEVINSLVLGTFNREGLRGPLSQLPATVGQTGMVNVTYRIKAPAIHLEVKTENGIVYLSGKAPNQASIDKAIRFAQLVPGVLEVMSSIKIGTD